MPINFKGGRLPAQPARPHLKLARLLHADLAAPPESSDWLSPVPSDAWGMLANDLWGDCGFAGMGHMRVGDVYVNQGETLTVTDDDALAAYSAVAGFDPDAGPSGDNPTDNGVVLQDVLDWWHKHGFLGEKPLAYARVDVSNLREVKQAIATFGQLYCGFNVPSSAMQQFNAGMPWSVVKGSRNEGGHCVTVGAYTEDGPDAVTWGRVQHMTWDFWATYFDECWVQFGPDDLNKKTGRDHFGLDLATLKADFGALTGRRLGEAS